MRYSKASARGTLAGRCDKSSYPLTPRAEPRPWAGRSRSQRGLEKGALPAEAALANGRRTMPGTHNAKEGVCLIKLALTQNKGIDGWHLGRRRPLGDAGLGPAAARSLLQPTLGCAATGAAGPGGEVLTLQALPGRAAPPARAAQPRDPASPVRGHPPAAGSGGPRSAFLQATRFGTRHWGRGTEGTVHPEGLGSRQARAGFSLELGLNRRARGVLCFQALLGFRGTACGWAASSPPLPCQPLYNKRLHLDHYSTPLPSGSCQYWMSNTKQRYSSTNVQIFFKNIK